MVKHPVPDLQPISFNCTAFGLLRIVHSHELVEIKWLVFVTLNRPVLADAFLNQLAPMQTLSPITQSAEFMEPVPQTKGLQTAVPPQTIPLFTQDPAKTQLLPQIIGE